MKNGLNPLYYLNEHTGVFVKPQQEPFAYSDGDEVELRIAGVIQNAGDLSVLSRELEAHCIDWPSRYHLSSTRSNLLRPYEGLLRGDILEVGAGCGAITRYLGESGGQITALEGSYRRATIAASRNRDMANVKVVCDNFLTFEDERRFDVVTLIGVLEYAQLFDNKPGAVERLLDTAKKFLKPEGVLLLAIENKLGLKYFAGMAEDHVNHGMYGVESLYRSGDPITFGRKELERLLGLAGFEKTTFALPFPDYKLPVSVVMPAAMNEDPDVFNASSFASESAHLDPQIWLPSLISLELGWQSLGSNELISDFSNSFLIAASPSSKKELADDYVLAYHYGSRRLDSYTKQTVFRRIGSEIKVEKRLHQKVIDKNSELGEDFYSPRDEMYLAGISYRVEFARIMARPSWSMQEIAFYFRRFVEFLVERYCAVPASSMNSDLVLRPEAIDVLPHNIIVSGGKLCPIDMEWKFQGPVELGFVLFRSLIYLINPLTRCGYPDDFGMADRREYMGRVYQDLFNEIPNGNFERWWLLEQQFQLGVTGNVDERSFDDWCSGSFPILDPSTRSIAAILLEVNLLRSGKENLEQTILRLSERARKIWDCIKVGSSKADIIDEESGNFDEATSNLDLQLTRLDARSRELFEDLSLAKVGAASLQDTVADLQGKIADLRGKVVELQGNAAYLQGTVTDLQGSLTETALLLESERAGAEDLRNVNGLILGEIARMQATLSWKLTKSLRVLSETFKRLVIKSHG